jgi:hypothetical protein
MPLQSEESTIVSAHIAIIGLEETNATIQGPAVNGCRIARRQAHLQLIALAEGFTSGRSTRPPLYKSGAQFQYEIAEKLGVSELTVAADLESLDATVQQYLLEADRAIENRRPWWQALSKPQKHEPVVSIVVFGTAQDVRDYSGLFGNHVRGYLRPNYIVAQRVYLPSRTEL